MMDEAKKIHYDFDPLMNLTKFSEFSGFCFLILREFQSLTFFLRNSVI